MEMVLRYMRTPTISTKAEAQDSSYMNCYGWSCSKLTQVVSEHIKIQLIILQMCSYFFVGKM